MVLKPERFNMMFFFMQDGKTQPVSGIRAYC